MNIRSIYKKYKKKKQLSASASHISIDSSAILGENFNLDLRAPKSGQTYLSIGEKSMIDSSFVFETDRGSIKVGDRVHIGGGTQLISRDGITIDDDVIIAWNCTIYDHNSHSVHWSERKDDVTAEWEGAVQGRSTLYGKNWDVVKSAPIHICEKAWIGFGVTVLKGVTIGEGAVIGAGSVVTKDIPPYSVACGNPATVVRTLTP
ncbi:MAG: acyltransferase [Roseburia sp.]